MTAFVTMVFFTCVILFLISAMIWKGSSGLIVHLKAKAKGYSIQKFRYTRKKIKSIQPFGVKAAGQMITLGGLNAFVATIVSGITTALVSFPS